MFVTIFHNRTAQHFEVHSHQGICAICNYYRYPQLESNAHRDAVRNARALAKDYGLPYYNNEFGMPVLLDPVTSTLPTPAKPARRSRWQAVLQVVRDFRDFWSKK